MVNGPAWKALIEEEFGDGIMSAIDFDMQIDREANPKGDRVKITMSGKFLPYKYYGNEQGIPEAGTKRSSAFSGSRTPRAKPLGMLARGRQDCGITPPASGEAGRRRPRTGIHTGWTG